MSIASRYLLCFLCFAVSVASSKRLSLSGSDWNITDELSNYTVIGTVPGTIHTNLMAAKKIPDMYLGYNDVDYRFLVNISWTFMKNFSLTPDILGADTVNLHLDQIDTVANISVNGCPVGRSNSMFIPYTFPVTKACLKTDNYLEVTFQSPIAYALDQSIAYNDTILPLCPPDVQHGECHVQFIRKEPCSFSWDWGPAFAPIGITGDIYIDAFNSTDIVIQLDTVNVAMYDKDNKNWRVDVMLSSEHESFATQLKFVLVNTTWSFATNITFNQNYSSSINIPDDQVQRWWPNGFGQQNLYNFSVFSQGQLIDSRIIGFRTVELIQETYNPNLNGTSFYFRINSQPIFIKGSNWIPPDSFQERVSDIKLERLLQSAQVAHMNMLRVWGGGIYERDSFYDIADRLGIMLWHDFMFACSLYPVDEPFLTNVRNEVLYQVKRLQSHPSIVLWAGNNENEAAVAQDWYRVPEEKKNQTRDEYRQLYVGTVMKAVQEVDLGNNRPFVTSSPSNGDESIKENYIAQDPQSPIFGDVHFYGYGNDSWDPTTYPTTRFLSETGLQALPSIQTWYEATQNMSDLDYDSEFLKHREHSENRLRDIMFNIQTNLPVPVTTDPLKKFTQLIYLSQINQAMTLKSISDHCRLYSSRDLMDPKTNQGNTMGIMYWQINDIWQAPTWATIEYNLKWKMGHNQVAHMYAPVYPLAVLTPYLADVNDESAKLSFYMINDFVNGLQGQLICSVYGLDRFSVRLSFGYDISMNGAGVQYIATLPYSVLMRRAACNNANPCVVHCYYYSASSTGIGQTLFLSRPKNYQLYAPNLQLTSVKQTSPNDYDIGLTASAPALFVWLDVSNGTSGYFSRNGFSMFEPSVTISFHSWETFTNLTIADFKVGASLYDVGQP